jgi:hypothetical protein
MISKVYTLFASGGIAFSAASSLSLLAKTQPRESTSKESNSPPLAQRRNALPPGSLSRLGPGYSTPAIKQQFIYYASTPRSLASRCVDGPDVEARRREADRRQLLGRLDRSRSPPGQLSAVLNQNSPKPMAIKASKATNANKTQILHRRSCRLPSFDLGRSSPIVHQAQRSQVQILSWRPG